MGGCSVGAFLCPLVLVMFGSVLLWQGLQNQGMIDTIQAELIDNTFINQNDTDKDADCSAGNVWTNVGETIGMCRFETETRPLFPRPRGVDSLEDCQKACIAQKKPWKCVSIEYSARDDLCNLYDNAAAGSSEEPSSQCMNLDRQGIITCEMTSAAGFKRNQTEDRGTLTDFYLFSVQNAEGVLKGDKPLMATIGPFEVLKQGAEKEISWFEDGEVHYKGGYTFKFREDVPTDLLNAEVVVPNVFYAAAVSAGLEWGFLSIFAGIGYSFQPNASHALLLKNLGGAGNLTEDDAKLAWTGLLTTFSTSKIGATLHTIMATWAKPKVGALFGEIMKQAIATVDFAFKSKYGTPGAPLFVKMTAAEALNWDGAGKNEPVFREAIGYKTLMDKLPASRLGDKILLTGEEHGAEKRRYIVQDNGVTQRCKFDPDCVKQDKYKQAKKEKRRATDQCDVDAVCRPLEVKGFSGGRLPAELFDDELGTKEFGEGSRVRVWVGGVAAFNFTNTGVHKWEMGGKKISHHRWSLSGVVDRRENCGGSEPNEGSEGIDCDSPKRTWSSMPWQAEPALPIYFSVVGFKDPAEVMFMSQGLYDDSPKRGSVQLVELNKTRLYTIGPYDPRDKVTFLNLPPIDHTVYLDTEVNMGTMIRANKPLQYSLRLKNPVIAPKVGDVLIPMYILHEYGEASASQHKSMRTLQGAVGFESFGGLVWLMLFLGSVMLGIGAFLITTRYAFVVIEKKSEKKGVTAKLTFV